MISVLERIKRKKQEFQEMKRRKSGMENIKRAEELQKLREERIRLEGKARLEKARQKEINRIERAKTKAPSKLQRFAQGLAGSMNEIKGQKKKSSKPNRSVLFGGLNEGSKTNFGGTRNIEFTGKGSPFNVGGKRKFI